MNSLVIYLPFCYPFSPYLAMPILAGQLKKYGFNTKCYDMNVEFHYDVYKKSFLEKSLQKAKDVLNDEKYKSVPDINISELDYSLPLEQKISVLKKNIIKNALIDNSELIDYTVSHVEDAFNIMKTDEFYKVEKFLEAQTVLQTAIEIAFLPYSPCVSRSLKKPIFTDVYKDIKYQALNKDINPYFEFFDEKINKGVFEDVNVIYLSVSHPNQLVPALTLSKQLKARYKDIKINIGGNYITRIKDAFIKNPEIFDEFIDTVILCDGENAVVELAQYFDGKRDISSVSNIVYKNEKGEVIENPIVVFTDLENRAIPSLDGIDFSKYLLPVNAFSIQSSKGCYWNKCTFCDYSFGKPVFTSYSVEKLIQELKYYKENYDIKCFEFVDDALVIDFFDKVADRLIEENLGVYIYCYFRLESNITKELLEKFYKAGVIGIQWGYEATSERIMKLMNKGIDVKNRLNILRMSAEAGIWNRVFGIAGYPTETEDEIISTLNTFMENTDIMNSFEIFHYGLFKFSKMNKNKEQFGIDEIFESGEFSTINNFSSKRLPKAKIAQVYSQLKKKIANKFWTKCIPDEYLMVFLMKYGAKELNEKTFKSSYE